MIALRPTAFALASILLGCAAPEAATAARPASPSSQHEDTAPEHKAPPPKGAPATFRVEGGCEGAKEAYIKQCTEHPEACPDHDGKQDISAGAYGAVLNKGSYLNTCGVPPAVEVKICAAIRDGRATGITVTTTPGEEAAAKCVAEAIGQIAFPASPHLDITTTVFAAQ